MNWKVVFLLCLIVLSIVPTVLAESADIDDSISSEDKAKFDEILKPVMKIYNLVKYIASVVAAIFLVFAGISYMSSGSDPRKRDQAKSIVGYVIIGLLIIWAAPYIVGLLA